MNAAAWISLASIAGFILLQTTVIAFAMGRLFQRVSTVEKGHDVVSAMSSDVAAMKSDIRHMAASIDDLKRTLDTPPARPRTRTAG